jgi:hypothetical protein
MIALVEPVVLQIEIDVGGRLGWWRFSFLRQDGTLVAREEDIEPDLRGEQLELVTLIRALESLDHPRTVLLQSASPYLEEGIRFGIAEWRASGWRWEYFDQLVPIKHRELWQRLDRVLNYHQLFFPQDWLLAGGESLAGLSSRRKGSSAGRECALLQVSSSGDHLLERQAGTAGHISATPTLMAPKTKDPPGRGLSVGEGGTPARGHRRWLNWSSRRYRAPRIVAAWLARLFAPARMGDAVVGQT